MIPWMPKSAEPSDPARAARSVSRRGLFGAGAGAGAAAIVFRPALAQESDNLPPSIPGWQLHPGEETLSLPYGRPSKFEANVGRRYRQDLPEPPTRLSSFSLTPLQDLCGIITPNGLHYERHHAGVPTIDPSEHRLIVHRLVKRALIFTMEDLTRFPSVSRVHFLECSGNTQNWGAPEPELTAQDTHGLLSCCEWTGVPVATVLAEAGVKPQAKWVLAEGADAAAMTRSIPIEKALDDALLRAAEPYGFGRPATPQEITGWDIDVSPSGAGLSPGRGDVRQGEAIFALKCAGCHGGHGEGKPMDRLVGGVGTLRDKKPEKTVGSFWPYATTLFDYVRRAMPLNAPQSLSPDEVYAVSAYVLYLNGIVPQDETLDAETLAKVKMPNRDGFVSAYPSAGAGAKP
jgi:mono/diheme cytochrome c family protein